MYKDASCNDEYGILANVKGATVAITDKAKNSPEMLDGDNKYPAGKDVVNDMKAFKIGKV